MRPHGRLRLDWSMNWPGTSVNFVPRRRATRDDSEPRGGSSARLASEGCTAHGESLETPSFMPRRRGPWPMPWLVEAAVWCALSRLIATSGSPPLVARLRRRPGERKGERGLKQLVPLKTGCRKTLLRVLRAPGERPPVARKTFGAK